MHYYKKNPPFNVGFFLDQVFMQDFAVIFFYMQTEPAPAIGVNGRE